ncbi:unnamed protein product [marine sediment metagenome]|uniref:PEGA domain-containing protein n=1 Tax=marine sediment metagenome TaxID=412755 RepID=X1UG62_9ZZZZ
MAEEIKLLLPGPPREERKISPALIIGAAGAGIGLAVILGLYAVAQARRPIPGECIIWGFVTDSLTGEAIPDVKITLDSLVRYTEWAGQYEIRDIACQQYRIQFSKEGYVTVTRDVVATADTQLNISL